MQKNKSEILFLCPQDAELSKVGKIEPDLIFSEISVEFLNKLSLVLMQNPLTRKYSDVATFAFFCRKSNVLGHKEKYTNDLLKIGRGVVFHIAPSNVPVNFAYSLVAGILSGNINIVRVPSKEFEQVDIICNAIDKVINMKEFMFFKERIFLVKYNKESTATSYLSSLCDVRVIWGGDETIRAVREFNPIPPRSFDITFADRYSLAIINADVLVDETNFEKLAENFYNDTYLFDQNACSAPRLIIWLGSSSNLIKAKRLFWDAVFHKLENYNLATVLAVDKLSALYSQSILCGGTSLIEKKNNKLWRVAITNLVEDVEQYKCAGGYFLEYDASSLDCIKDVVNRKYQTLSYYGFSKEELNLFIYSSRMNGIDRVVPFGKTAEFNFTWDGYDLIASLSRKCFIL